MPNILEILEEKRKGAVKKRKYKGKTYKATPGGVAAAKAGDIGAFEKWADNPYAAKQAATIVATGKPMKRKKKGSKKNESVEVGMGVKLTGARLRQIIREEFSRIAEVAPGVNPRVVPNEYELEGMLPDLENVLVRGGMEPSLAGELVDGGIAEDLVGYAIEPGKPVEMSDKFYILDYIENEVVPKWSDELNMEFTEDEVGALLDGALFIFGLK